MQEPYEVTIFEAWTIIELCVPGGTYLDEMSVPVDQRVNPEWQQDARGYRFRIVRNITRKHSGAKALFWHEAETLDGIRIRIHHAEETLMDADAYFAVPRDEVLPSRRTG